MYKAALYIAVASVLAACGSSETKTDVPVRDASTATTQSGTGGSGSTSSGLTTSTVKGDPTKDPNNILSKRQIFFEFDKFEIKNEYKSLVEAHAKYLRENPNAKMLIQGNADERGSREYNVGLGQRRSDTVKRALILLGARDGQIESVSLGEEKPMCTDHAEGCWAKNRRDDMLYNGEY